MKSSLSGHQPEGASCNVTVLTNLLPEQCGSYEALTTALDTLFGLSDQNWMWLKATTRRRDESFAELAEDVEHLMRLAYPKAAEAMVKVLAKDSVCRHSTR